MSDLLDASKENVFDGSVGVFGLFADDIRDYKVGLGGLVGSALDDFREVEGVLPEDHHHDGLDRVRGGESLP